MGGQIDKAIKGVIATKVTQAVKKVVPTGSINTMWKYPLESQEDMQGRIVFKTHTVQGLTPEKAFGFAAEIANAIQGEDATDLLKKTAASALISRTNLENYIPGGSKGFIKDCGDKGKKTGPSSQLAGEAVQLYLPSSLPFFDGVTYNTATLGATGAAMEAGLAAGGSALGTALKAMVTEGASLIEGMWSGAKDEVGSIALAKAASLAPEGIGNGIRSAARVIANPNTRVLFEGVQHRTFSFTFKMIPKSAEEATHIENIIKFFRKEQYPKPITIKGVKAGFHFPNKFEIVMYGQGNTRIGPKIGYCYLQTVNVTYNATGMGLHEDGKFTEYDMSLTFTEERPLDKTLIEEEGY